ncbi:hydantoinase/oxoprolinase family protein [Alterisphingorhabdus coralli]|uniref:Hydantoinase/oxoprolinase family protein n=1 Tax=Alterisphingorhabdus coralli TaxID=3071408 RepID=A0AA97F8F6_9SPHN|nr:hydantoinase/oxoprolinase family protein [Parasphingorhabdus sp. SCSIO 66989]WOE75203.1 hydantoinase/oxoprolinase family protein [Parasphingorhabdus sp. SCSIO 66989]
MTKASNGRSSASKLRLGIDVGGTNTDAVLMDGDNVVGAVKRATSEDIAQGVIDAVTALLDETSSSPSEVSRVMIGTTQFVNAFLQRRNLARTAVLRAALPKTDGVPPKVCWPEDLLAKIGHNVHMVEGGAFYTGKDYRTLDTDAVARIAAQLVEDGVESLAISSVFAPIRPDLEEAIADIVADIAPGIAITKSADLGGVGLVDRENAAIINASLVPFAHQVVASMQGAFRDMGFAVSPLYSQNDGTLITGERAEAFPILTCAAGPTNSIRGAGFLTGSQDAVVVDIGGTTTDIGFLTKGFPRETSSANYIGGVRTNFRMPDILSIALGGGSHVKTDGDNISIGPESVGFRLTEEAMIFGGTATTATDIAVGSGLASLGDVTKVQSLPDDLLKQAVGMMQHMVEDAIDQMRSSAKPIDVILVGGGSILIGNDLRGAARLLRPEHAGVANAVGAAIAQVSGRIDKLYDYGEAGREAALERAKSDAIANAVSAGATENTVEIVDIEELPMTHMQSSAVQVRVNAVGELS